MLTVSKHFKPEFTNSKQWAVASNMKSSVMLDVVQTEELRHIGISREVTNRIQRLRKTSGISIDDQIEIYYSFRGQKQLSSVLPKYTDRIMAQTRMPVLPISQMEGSPVLIGNTEFAHPEDESDVVDVKIVLASPKLTAAFEAEFGKHGAKFVADVRNYLGQFDRKVLQEKAKSGGVNF